MFWKKPRRDTQPVVSQGGFSLGNSGVTAGSNAVASQGSYSPSGSGQIPAQAANIDAPSRKQSSERAACVVQRGRILSGTFSFSTPIRIEGTLRGRLFSSSTVLTSEGSTIDAEANIRKLVSYGHILGPMVTVESAELRAGSTMATRLVAQSVTAEPGCKIDGQLVIGSDAAP